MRWDRSAWPLPCDHGQALQPHPHLHFWSKICRGFTEASSPSLAPLGHPARPNSSTQWWPERWLPAPQLSRLHWWMNQQLQWERKDLMRGASLASCQGGSRKGYEGEIRQVGTTLSQHHHPRLRQFPRRTRLKGTAAPLPTGVSRRQEAGKPRTPPHLHGGALQHSRPIFTGLFFLLQMVFLYNKSL